MKRIKQIILTTSVILPILLTVPSCSLIDDDYYLGEGKELAEGCPVPQFSVKTTDGMAYTEKSFTDKNTVFAILVFSTECVYSRSLLQQIDRIIPKNFPIIGLVIENAAKTKAIQESMRNPFPMAPDISADIIKAFPVKELPGLFIFDEKGYLSKKISREKISDEALSELLSSKKI